MVEIREARREEADAVANLWVAMKEADRSPGRRWALSSDARERFEHHLIGHFLADRDAMVFVAVSGGEIVGYITCEIHHLSPVFEDQRSLHLDSMEVRADHQNQGIGKKLVERALQWGHNEGARSADASVALTNTVAIGFLHEVGFQDVKLRLSRDI